MTGKTTVWPIWISTDGKLKMKKEAGAGALPWILLAPAVAVPKLEFRRDRKTVTPLQPRIHVWAVAILYKYEVAPLARKTH